MASTNVKLCIWYAPLPEERNPDASASRSFADRIAEQQQLKNTTTVVKLIDLETVKSTIAAAAGETSSTTIHFFIISCDADGSVHKAVRKSSRELTKQAQQNKEGDSASSITQNYIAVALLGHARCENSAQQMKDTIFTAGRKFDKAATGLGARLIDRVEVQAELEGPEVVFDPWVKATLEDLAKRGFV